MKYMQSNLRIGAIVFRCFEFEQTMAFWMAALSYVPREPATKDWVVLKDASGKGPNLSLHKVADKPSGKRSRLHLDLYTHHQKEEVVRLIRLGAKSYPWDYEKDDDFVVLADPDDNLFCVVQLPAAKNH